MTNKFDNFPRYTQHHFYMLMNTITPVERDDLGYLVKRDDHFSLGGLRGGKVRQALSIVQNDLYKIRTDYNRGLITGAGLPSPQTCITAGVAKYFGLRCAIVTFRYDNNKMDFNRINISLAQKLGADVYGVECPRKSSIDAMTKKLAGQLGFYQVDFGMSGRRAIDIVTHQCANIPDEIKTIVMVGGSGFSALGVALGLQKYNKKVEKIIVICMSRYTAKNKAIWYDPLPDSVKFRGEFDIIHSDIPYSKLYNPYKDFRYDLTYESKAYQWLEDNILPTDNALFWVVGIREYDLNYIEDIRWHTVNDTSYHTLSLF